MTNAIDKEAMLIDDRIAYNVDSERELRQDSKELYNLIYRA